MTVRIGEGGQRGTGTLEPHAPAPGEIPARLGPYQVLGLLGRGGMGEVYRVHDPALSRTVALKVIRADAAGSPHLVARFLQEARITAQLQHPGTIPLYTLGELPDGRPYYTMEEVRGRTLKDMILAVHRGIEPASGLEPTPPDEPIWTFRRLIDAFHNVCVTMSYAHSRGIVHRDLKPINIMVGAFGEVLVLDWGLAYRAAGATAPEEDDAPLSDGLPVGLDGEPLTRVGSITGTPAYMSPEQAHGRTERLLPTSDVYSLGAILYEILSGRPPYEGRNPLEVLGQVRGGPPQPPRRFPAVASPAETLADRTLLLEEADASEPGIDPVPPEERPPDVRFAPPIAEELEAICLKAMARDPAARYPHAGLLAREIEAWLDGARRHEQALEIVGEADRLLPEIAALKTEAADLRRRIQALQDALDADASDAERKPLRTLEDRAEQLEREANLKDAAYVQRLHAALMHQPDLPEACSRLADVYRDQHARAEAQGDEGHAAQSQALLRMYDRGRYAAYLKGDGAVSLVTDPPGAEVLLFRYELEDRRLVPRFLRALGRTPLRQEPLPMGSYLLMIRSPRGGEVRYPVFIGRQQHWDGIPPGGSAPAPLYLPRPDELGPEDLYVPAGWFQCGYEGIGSGSLARGWRWVDGFVVRKFPVTNREYLAFLNDLLARGREEVALRHAPREASGTASEQGAIIYGRDDDGRFVLRTDSWGMQWLEEFPVHMIDWYDACAYAAWEAERSGRAWRLLRELEWEKAARGVDARLCPWGDFAETAWMRGSRRGARATVAVVDSYPYDESPCGVRGMGGNVRDWCEDTYEYPRRAQDEPALPAEACAEGEVAHRVIRGGCWQSTAVHLGLVARFLSDPISRYYEIGFRLGRSLPDDPATR